jgi:hypothetical protein
MGKGIQWQTVVLQQIEGLQENIIIVQNAVSSKPGTISIINSGRQLVFSDGEIPLFSKDIFLKISRAEAFK